MVEAQGCLCRKERRRVSLLSNHFNLNTNYIIDIHILYVSLVMLTKRATRIAPGHSWGNIITVRLVHFINKFIYSKFSNFDGDLYKVHTHSQGTRCWNGPERSVKAMIECGLENEIIEVSEPEKCEYHFRMLSPAVCQHAENNQEIKNAKPIHEEL